LRAFRKYFEKSYAGLKIHCDEGGGGEADRLQIDTLQQIHPNRLHIPALALNTTELQIQYFHRFNIFQSETVCFSLERR